MVAKSDTAVLRETMRTMRRRKLHDGAKIDHPIHGTLTIRVSVEGFRAAGEGAEPAEHWEAINSEGRRVVPLAFTERGLHFVETWNVPAAAIHFHRL